jgi:hypothetical protein
VGVHDNFFDLGGHSLLAMQVISRTRAAVRRDIPLKALFMYPSVAQFATKIAEFLETLEEREVSALGRSSGRTDLPVAANQEKRLMLEECMARENIPCPASNLALVLDFLGKVDLKVLDRALNEVIRRHQILNAAFFPAREISTAERSRRCFEFMRTGTFQLGLFRHSILDAPALSLRVTSLRDMDQPSQKQALDQIVLNELQAAFSYAAPPLMRATAVQLSGEHTVLVIAVPHLVCDGRGIQILHRELRLLYSAIAANQPSPLSEVTYQFSDFALWQHQYLNGPAAKAAIRYWTKEWSDFGAERMKLEDFPYAILNPADLKRAATVHTEILEQTSTEKLRDFARDSGATMYMLFLASFYVALYCHTGKSRIAIWANFANRILPEFDGMIGWFVNSHILGVDLRQDPTAAGLLSQVRTKVLDANTYQELPTVHLWRTMGQGPSPEKAMIFFDFAREERPFGHPPDPASPVIIEEKALASFVGPGDMTRLLSIAVVDQGETIKVNMAFNAALSDAAMRSFLRLWISLTLALAERPDTPISDLRSYSVAVQGVSNISSALHDSASCSR